MRPTSLSIEKDIHSRQAISSRLSVSLANVALALIWIYHGIVPKILFPHSGEIEFLQKAALFTGHEITALWCFGILEICFGLLLLCWQSKYTHFLNIAALIALAIGAFWFDAASFVKPFDPFTLNLAMITISAMALCHIDKLPRSGNGKSTFTKK